MDEAAFLPESLVTEVALPMMATCEGRLTLISTPFGRNHFWRAFQMGQRGENGFWSRQAPSSENPLVQPAFLAVQKELVSERAYAVEYEAQFDEAAGKVFPNDKVQACLTPRLGSVSGPFVVGVDWARYRDYTAVAVLAGHRDAAKLVGLRQWRGMDWVGSVAEVARIIDSFPGCRVLCDATGVGDPVLEMLRAAAPSAGVTGLVFSPAVKRELVDGLAMLVDRAALQMEPDPALLRQLDRFEAKTTPAGNLRLEAAGNDHDDLVVALALACRLLPKEYRPAITLGPPRRFSQDSQNHAEHLFTKEDSNTG